MLLALMLALVGMARTDGGGHKENGERIILSFGDAVTPPAPVPPEGSGGEICALTLPIYLSGIPEEGICGLLFWVDIQGRIETPAVSVTAGVTGAGMGDVTLTWQTYPREGEGVICGILFDSKENFKIDQGETLCFLTLTLGGEHDELALTIIPGSMACMSPEGEVIPLEVRASLPYYTCGKTSHTEEDMTHPRETLPSPEEETVPSPIENAISIAPPSATFVGVQHTARQSRREGDTTYAVRFLFMWDGESPFVPEGQTVICLIGGGVLKLSLHTKDFVLSDTPDGQMKVYPPQADARWVAYTFEGLSLTEEYAFWVYDGKRGAATCVTFRDGGLSHMEQS